MNKKLAKEFLFIVEEVFRKHNITIYLLGGVLLGAIREKDFISSDYDIDLGVKEKFWENLNLLKEVIIDLEKRDIKIKYLYNNQILRLQLKKHKLSLVLIHLKRTNKEYVKYSSQGRGTYPLDCIDTLDEINFLGRKFKIPHNPKKFLENVYGKDWKIPVIKTDCKYYNFTPLKWIVPNKKINFKITIPLFKEHE